jgi:hypothetical protein
MASRSRSHFSSEFLEIWLHTLTRLCARCADCGEVVANHPSLPPNVHAPSVTDAMRQVARLLLAEELDLPDAVWPSMATYLTSRIQSTAKQKPGRSADMSEEAAAAMKAALSDGAAPVAFRQTRLSQHKFAAREEAARLLLLNMTFVVKDVCNSSATEGIYGGPLTQTELKRLPAESAPHMELALREVSRRLLEQRCTRADASAWVRAAEYLAARIQSTPEEKPGRTPDMSPEQAAAMRAALEQMKMEGTALLLDTPSAQEVASG